MEAFLRQAVKYSGIFAAFGSLFLFSLNPVIVATIPGQTDPVSMAYWAYFFAIVFLFLFVILFGRQDFKHVIYKLTFKSWAGLFISSLIRLLVTVSFFFAITMASRIEATILTLMWPIFFVALSILFDSYRIKFFDLFLLFCSFIGASIIVYGDSNSSLNVNYGYIIALLSAFLGGLHSLIYKKTFDGSELPNTLKTQIVLILIRSIIGFSLIGIFNSFENTPDIQPITSTFQGLHYLALGVFCYAGTQVLYCYALVKMDQVELSNIQYFNPVIVSLSLFIFLGDTITFSLIIGTCFIFFSQYLIFNRKKL